MTNEEAIEMLKAKLECITRDVSGRDDDCNRRLCGECRLNYEKGTMGEQKEYLRMSIEALERQHCEDAISRQAVLSMQYRIDDSATLSSMDVVNVDDIEDLPPVTPQSKTGLWIKSRDSYGNNHFTCPFCEHDIATKYAGTWEDNYCSNCGARLESEDKK